MKNNSIKKLLALVLAFVLTAAAALTGCSTTPAETTAPPAETQPVTEVGEGAANFELTIVDKDGVTHLYRVHTNVGMMGEALTEVDLIDGEQGPYGMYIKSVLGQVLDYETDGMYWSFYVNGEYAQTGVDQIPVEHDGKYMLKAEAAE
ncbi:MAG: DUF4430 domain-containing protein, partial [Oscillospiraceae bacterium]|nr:DUF4430 domain-containing protein [Oscillospiraceae bacterium]MBQ7099699.1 DUF4430 domain-containing protein [Oscillospiraceae bacterium]